MAFGQSPHLCLVFNNFYISLIISRIQKPVKSLKTVLTFYWLGHIPSFKKASSSKNVVSNLNFRLFVTRIWSLSNIYRIFLYFYGPFVSILMLESFIVIECLHIFSFCHFLWKRISKRFGTIRGWVNSELGSPCKGHRVTLCNVS